MSEDSDRDARRRAEELARAFLARVWGGAASELDAIDELMTEDYLITSAGRTVRGRAAFKDWVREFRRVLPEARNEVLDVFASADGERVVSRWICSGRNNGIFGLPPDDRPVSFSGIAIWRVRDGRLAECWVERAALEAYRALAQSPPPRG